MLRYKGKYFPCCSIHYHSRRQTYLITNNIIKSTTDHTYAFNGIILEFRKFEKQITSCTRNTEEEPNMIIVTAKYYRLLTVFVFFIACSFIHSNSLRLRESISIITKRRYNYKEKCIVIVDR